MRGSAKKRITSDLAEWSASVTTTKKDRVEAYTALKKDVEAVTAFIEAAAPKIGAIPDQRRRAGQVVLPPKHQFAPAVENLQP